MCPIGTGMLDYPAIYKVLLTEEIHYNGYITVEQERDAQCRDEPARCQGQLRLPAQPRLCMSAS